MTSNVLILFCAIIVSGKILVPNTIALKGLELEGPPKLFLQESPTLLQSNVSVRRDNSRQRIRRDSRTGPHDVEGENARDAIKKEREVCWVSDEPLTKLMPVPHCKKYYKDGRDPNYRFALGKLETEGWYRLLIKSVSKEGIQFLAISVLSPSLLFIGKFSLVSPCPVKNSKEYDSKGGTCSTHPTRAEDVPPGIKAKLKPELGVFVGKRNFQNSELAKAGMFSTFYLNVFFSPEDELALGKKPDGSFDSRRNKFSFIISTKEWDFIEGGQKIGGDCYFNHHSPVYSLGGQSKKPMSCSSEQEDLPSDSALIGGNARDKKGNPVISTYNAPLEEKEGQIVGTTSSTKSPYAWRPVDPIITDPNALLPEFQPPKNPGYVSKEETTQRSESKKELTGNAIYSGCGKKKGCIGEPSGCIKTKSCSSVVTYGEDDDFVKFEVLGRAGKYVAVGLSWDNAMGNDSVVECVREYRSQVNAYLSWNFPNRKNSREDEQLAISRVRGAYDNGHIMCEFWRKRISVHHGKKFDLSKDDFYVLQARGNSAGEGKFGNIGYHSEGSTTTKSKYTLHTRFRKTKLRVAMEKVHGALMLFAWLLCFPLSAFMSRYFKETYKNRSCSGYTIWYAWHVIIAWVGLGATLIAMASSLLGMELWNQNFSYFGRYFWHFHVKAGIALLALTFLLPATGYATKKLNPRRRCQAMNYIHAILAQVSIWFSIAIIYRTTSLDDGLPCSSTAFIITWIIFYILLHVSMSYLVCYVDFVHGERVSRAYNIFLLRTAPHLPFEDVTGSPIRKIFLCLFISSLGLITGTIILMYMFTEACVEATED